MKKKTQHRLCCTLFLSMTFLDYQSLNLLVNRLTNNEDISEGFEDLTKEHTNTISKKVERNEERTFKINMNTISDINYMYFVDSCKEIFFLKSNRYIQNEGHITYCKSLANKKIKNLGEFSKTEFDNLPMWLKIQIKICIIFRYLFSISKAYVSNIVIDMSFDMINQKKKIYVYSIKENRKANSMDLAISDKYRIFFQYRKIEHEIRDFLLIYKRENCLKSIDETLNDIEERIERRSQRLCIDSCGLGSIIKSILKTNYHSLVNK